MEINSQQVSGMQGSRDPDAKGRIQKPGGGGDPKTQIAKNISDATASVNSISTYENQLNELNRKIAGYKQTIQDLQKQINALPDSDPRKATVSSDLKKAQNLLQTFQTVSDHLVQISNDFKALQDEENISTPTPDQAAKANALAAEIATFTGQIPSSFPDDAAINTMNQAIAQVKTDIAAANTTITNVLQDLHPSLTSSPGGNASYIDLAKISDHILDFMRTDNAKNSKTFDATAFYQYSKSLMDQLRSSGAKEINMSFAQFSDIEKMGNGDASMFINGIDNYPDVIKSDFTTFIQAAKDDQMRTNFSFGGGLASGFNPCPKGEKPEDQATKVAKFMQNYNIDGVDFDIETLNFASTGGENAIKFLQSLHQQLSAQGKSMTLTPLGKFSHAAFGDLASIFYSTPEKVEEAATAIADGTKPPKADRLGTMFDAVQLPLYNVATQYYIDPNSKSWGIEQWCDVVGDASKIRIGFDDTIPYKSPDSWGTPDEGGKDPFDVSQATSNGQAAAMIFQQLQEQLTKDGYGKLGAPFWWPDYGTTPATADRYTPINTNGTYSVNFHTDAEMQAFYNTLNNSR